MSDLEKPPGENYLEGVIEILPLLNERQREIVSFRLGLLSGQSRTIEETEAEFGITREKIRQTEARALRLIRERKNGGGS